MIMFYSPNKFLRGCAFCVSDKRPRNPVRTVPKRPRSRNNNPSPRSVVIALSAGGVNGVAGGVAEGTDGCDTGAADAGTYTTCGDDFTLGREDRLPMWALLCCIDVMKFFVCSDTAARAYK
jgi:hypothetical protein